jgi:import inner membrane translocase subunit TIM13
MAQVRAEVQAANAKELLESLTDKCYMKCVTKPGTSLSSSEEVRV